MTTIYESPDDHSDKLIEGFAAKFKEKYMKGQEEHSGNLWEVGHMLDRAEEEVLDQWSYIQTAKYQQQIASYVLSEAMLEKDWEKVKCAYHILKYGKPHLGAEL